MVTEKPASSAAKHSPHADDAERVAEYEDRILISLRRMIRAVDLYSKELAQRYTLTGPQLVCLRVIERSEEITPSQIASEVSLSQATITGILDRLETRGCLNRTRHQKDRRRVMVSLTDEGRRLVAAVPSPLHERFARRLAQLPEQERGHIDTVLQRIVQMMEADELDAAPLLSTGPILASPAEVSALMGEEKPTS